MRSRSSAVIRSAAHEEVYELAPLQLSKPDPEDVFTFEERAAVLKPYL